MIKDPMLYVLVVLGGLLWLGLRALAQRLDYQAKLLVERIDMMLTNSREVSIGLHDEVSKALRRLENNDCNGVVLVLGTINYPNKEPKQFCSGRTFKLKPGERSEFAETVHCNLLPGTIVIALGNVMLEAVFANQATFHPWGLANAGMPVSIVPEPLLTGAQLRVGVRGHAW